MASLLFDTYRFVSLEDGPESDSILTLDYTPSILGRLFGLKPDRVQFLGDCTVWHRLPGCKREGVLMESMLSDFWTMGRYRNAMAKKEARP